ncbi:hypothetical protein BGW39_008429 [Mortierella sp. 14UC]|nr:hypothetical protein BGW39_008429 [Mortierella sp. 14UC]
MVLWSSGSNGGRGRILSSKRTLLSGSLLLLVLFYYVALPDPQVSTLDDRTSFHIENAFRKHKKGRALADDTEIMMPLPVREDGPVNKALPWSNSFVERVKVRTMHLDRRLPVMDYLRGEQGTTVDSNGAVSTSSARTATVDATTGMDMLADREPLANPFSGTDKDVSLEFQPVEMEVMEDDEGNFIDVTPVEDSTSKSADEWSDEKEAESIQEEDDEQGFEKEDGVEQELLELEQAEAVSEMEAEAKARVEKAEEVLEDATEELREERQEEILEEIEEAILDRIEEAEEESGGVLTEKMVRMIEEFDAEDVVEVEDEGEYNKEDLLGQAGPGETMDDE